MPETQSSLQRGPKIGHARSRSFPFSLPGLPRRSIATPTQQPGWPGPKGRTRARLRARLFQANPDYVLCCKVFFFFSFLPAWSQQFRADGTSRSPSVSVFFSSDAIFKIRRWYGIESGHRGQRTYEVRGRTFGGLWRRCTSSSSSSSSSRSAGSQATGIREDSSLTGQASLGLEQQ